MSKLDKLYALKQQCVHMMNSQLIGKDQIEKLQDMAHESFVKLDDFHHNMSEAMYAKTCLRAINMAIEAEQIRKNSQPEVENKWYESTIDKATLQSLGHITTTDTKELLKFGVGLVMGGGLYLVHPTIGKIVIGLSIAGLCSHTIDRIVDTPEKANS